MKAADTDGPTHDGNEGITILLVLLLKKNITKQTRGSIHHKLG